MTIARKLFLGFLGTILLTAVIAGLGLFHVRELKQDAERAERGRRNGLKLREVQLSILAQTTAARNYLRDRQPDEMTAFITQASLASLSVDRLRMTPIDSLDADHLLRLERQHRQFTAEWRGVLERFADLFAVCRIGDDMGFKTATLMAPATLIAHVVPQYARLAALIHRAGRPFLLHSCGRIFDLMEPLIAAGIDAKHSNEDAIAPFDEWIDRYGNRIGLFGGIDADRLCRMSPDDVYEFVLEQGMRYRRKARGLALGSGNSIPAYIPPDGYHAMIRASQEIRRREATA